MHNINLLPPAACQRFKRKRTVWAWSKLLLLGVLLTSAAIAWGQSTATKIRQQTEQRLELVQLPSSVQRQHATLTNRVRGMLQYENQQIEQRSRYSPLVVIRMLHQLKQDLGGQLYASSIEFVEQPPTTPPSDQALKGYTALQLVANGSTSCTDLMQRIRDTNLFRDVKLSSPLELIDPHNDALRFTLRCEF